jgi:uncharacterized membrane-anchored protein YitT (DUF2179 family)
VAKIDRKAIRDYISIFLGSLVTALALNWFLIPNRIATGGVSGFATILFHLFKIPVGLLMALVNIPLFALGWRNMGHRFALRSLFGAMSVSFLIDLLAPQLVPLTSDPLLATIYGGALSGVGLGITFRAGGSTGGTDLGAQLLHRFLKTSPGFALMVIDFLVILLAGIVFDAELALYGILGLFLTSMAIDLLQEGVPLTRAAYIISEHNSEISQAILNQMERGVTELSGKGLYTGQARPVLFVIVARFEVSQLKSLVAEIDPKAFVVITSASEVLGEGFKRFT